MHQISRHNVLKSTLALAALPFTPLLFSAFRNIFTHPVSEHDLQLLECAGELYQKKSDYQSAAIILHSILDRFKRENSSTEVIQLKAYAFGALGLIYQHQHRIEESLTAFHNAFTLWKAIHNREHQADLLIRTGGVYSYTVSMDGIRSNIHRGLQCYKQAASLLKPSLKTFAKLRGRCDAAMGEMYYWMEEYELAEQFGRQGIEFLDEDETNWVYQTCRQH